MIKTMKVHVERMKECAAKGFINATDCADYLVKKGRAFRDAYKTTGQLVAYCIDHDEVLETLPLNVYQSFDEVFDEDIYHAISLLTCIENRKVEGGPAPVTCQKAIERMVKKLEALK